MDKRLNQIQALINQLASRNFDYKISPSESQDELDALKRANMFSPDRSKSGTNNANAPTPSRNSDRLIKEREILLGTGAYDEQHPIIVQIDKQISEFQNSSFHDYS